MNCNSSKGKCFDQFTKKKLPISAKIMKNLIFIDFSAMYPESCFTIPCPNGLECIAEFDSFECKCPTNKEGTTCLESKSIFSDLI